MLKVHDVFLAEFECLYDKDPAMFGQIDPNALSAGGFPILFLNGLLEEFYAVQAKDLTWNNKDTYDVIHSKVESIISSAFNLQGNQLFELTEMAVNTLGEVFLYDASDEIITSLSDGLRNINKDQLLGINPRLSSDYSICKHLFADRYSVCFIHSKLWEYHRLCIIQKLNEFVENGNSFNNFSNSVLKQVFTYVAYFIDACGILADLKPNETRDVSDYKVSWESDLGYMTKYLLKSKFSNVTTNVLHDLHAKSNIFIPMPLKCYLSILSYKKAELLYDLMLNNIKTDTEEKYIICHASKDYPFIEYDKATKKCVLKFSIDSILDLNDAKTAEDSITDYYIQYAYLFRDISNDKININKKCDRIMYLSSFLNAKAALFKIYEEMEAKKDLLVERPKTEILFSSELKISDYADFINEGKLIVKEGGVCSTGGSEVNVLNIHELDTYTTGYSRPILQKYVPSFIFTHFGDPVHAHARKISIINNSGTCCHLGYVFKISYKGKTNSSGFITLTLCFAENGEFIYGMEISKKVRFFHKLSDVDLALHIGEEEFQLFLMKVKCNWVKAIWLLNKYIEVDFKKRVNALVEAEIVDKIYLLQ